MADDALRRTLQVVAEVARCYPSPGFWPLPRGAGLSASGAPPDPERDAGAGDAAGAARAAGADEAGGGAAWTGRWAPTGAVGADDLGTPCDGGVDCGWYL